MAISIITVIIIVTRKWISINVDLFLQRPDDVLVVPNSTRRIYRKTKNTKGQEKEAGKRKEGREEVKDGERKELEVSSGKGEGSWRESETEDRPREKFRSERRVAGRQRRG